MDIFGPYAPFVLALTVVIGGLALARGLARGQVSTAGIWTDQVLKTVTGLTLIVVFFAAWWQAKELMVSIWHEFIWQQPEVIADGSSMQAFTTLSAFVALVLLAFHTYRPLVGGISFEQGREQPEEPQLSGQGLARLALYLGKRPEDMAATFMRVEAPKAKRKPVPLPRLGLALMMVALLYVAASLYQMSFWNKATAELTAMEDVCQYVRVIGDHTGHHNVACDDPVAAGKLQAAGWSFDRHMVAATFRFSDSHGGVFNPVLTRPRDQWAGYAIGGQYNMHYNARNPAEADMPDPWDGYLRLLAMALAGILPRCVVMLFSLQARLRRGLNPPVAVPA